MLERLIIRFVAWFIFPLGYKIVKDEKNDVDMFV